MSETVVRELSDGEEMVIEGVSKPSFSRSMSDDPRDRALETRRQVFEQASKSDSGQW
ncbi:MAG: hypothetical protein ABIR28_00805 [Vicinamibacteria bacterium]